VDFEDILLGSREHSVRTDSNGTDKLFTALLHCNAIMQSGV